MQAFDLQRMLLDKDTPGFLWEVAARCLFTFLLVFLFLKITGRRGVRQMSLFEVLIILTLGSAAGDVAFYDNVPILPVLMVFLTLGVFYRLVMWLMAHSERLENLFEGKPIIIVEEGALAWERLQAEHMTEYECFMELRLSGIEHLGQIRRAILETNGQISVYFYPDKSVRPGLPILPFMENQRVTLIADGGEYACVRCSVVQTLTAGQEPRCGRCGHHQWLKASREPRIT